MIKQDSTAMPPAARRGGRTRAAHLGPERRRPLVLDAALGLFAERGYRATSIEAIAEKAGVSRSVVYDCYPDKRALYSALLEREQERLVQHLLAAVPPEPPLDEPEELLRLGFTGFLAAAHSAPDAWRLIFAADPGGSREIASGVQRAREMITGVMSGLTAATLDRKRIPDPDRRHSTLIAYLIVGQAEASVRLMLDQPGVWEPEELGALLARMTVPALDRLG